MIEIKMKFYIDNGISNIIEGTKKIAARALST